MNKLEEIKAQKTTENGDISYSSTGNHLLDLFFMISYFEKHLDRVSIGTDEKSKLFSCFIRDPRFGLGRRDLGRELMKKSGISPELAVQAGRFDDLLYIATDEALSFWKKEIEKGNTLAKKWAPRLTGKNSREAKVLADMWKLSQKEYRKFIKTEDTVEYKLSYSEFKKEEETPLDKLFESKGECVHPLAETINFEQVPSLAMIKYYNTFLNRDDLKDNFRAYLESVKKGEKKLNISTTNVYDIYRNRDVIDADIFFDKFEKISISAVPVVDTSGSMLYEDAMGKALSIGHYLGKCSTYCPDQVVCFSSRPHLMKIKGNNYCEEIDSLYTGDYTNTDLGKVMELFEELETQPDYIIILTDMEFDEGSSMSKNRLAKLWKKKGYTTKIVWWNFNNRNKTVPEIDKNGNIFISGYSPMMLKYLETGFDANKFLDKLLEEYRGHVASHFSSCENGEGKGVER